MIYVLHTKLSENLHESQILSLIKKFPSNFQDRLLKYRRWQDCQASVLGRLLLKYGTKQFFKYSLDYNNISYSKSFKPFLSNHNISFNISHSGLIVLCALTIEEDIGIDIEKIDKNINITDFKNQMTDYEYQSIIISKNQTNAFYNWWTQKEAVVKLLGGGLSIPLNSFEVKDFTCKLYKKEIFISTIDLDSDYKSSMARFNDISDMIIQEVGIKKLIAN